MFDFYQRRKLKTALAAPVTRIILFILVIMMSWSAFSRYQIAKDMDVRRESAQRELNELKAHKESLEGQVQYLKDDRGIEAEMRRQFDVALDNEQVVVIVEPETDETNSSDPTYKKIEEPAWYQFWR